MREYGGVKIKDVEVLTCKKNNHYFSISCYLENKSEYTAMKLLRDKDSRVTKRLPVNTCSCGDMSDSDYIVTANFIIKLVDKINAR